MLVSPQDIAFPSSATTVVGEASSSYSPLCAAALSISPQGMPLYTPLEASSESLESNHTGVDVVIQGIYCIVLYHIALNCFFFLITRQTYNSVTNNYRLIILITE
jgi:hypothetical protein